MTLILYLFPLLFLFEDIFNTGILKNLKDSKVSKDFKVQYFKLVVQGVAKPTGCPKKSYL